MNHLPDGWSWRTQVTRLGVGGEGKGRMGQGGEPSNCEPLRGLLEGKLGAVLGARLLGSVLCFVSLLHLFL